MTRHVRIPLCLALSSLIPAFALDIGPVEVHGFISQGYLQTDDNNYLAEDSSDGTGKFFEAALNASWQATEYLRVGAQGFCYTLGELGDYDVSLDWAYVDLSPIDEIGLRAGLVKQPRGFYNEYQDIDLARTTVIMPTSIYDPILRDYNLSFWGGDIYGVLGAGEGDIEYHVYGGTRILDKDGGVASYFVNGLATGGFDAGLDELEQDPMFGGSLIWNTPVNGLRVGFSLAYITSFYGEYSGVLGSGAGLGLPGFLDGSDMEGSAEVIDYVNWIVSAEYVWDDFRVTGEYGEIDADIENEVIIYNGFLPGGQAEFTENDPYEPKGGYLQVAWRFHPKLEAAGTSSMYFATSEGSDPWRHQYDYYASLRYDPVEWLTLKAELHYIEGYAQMQVLINPNGFEDETWMGAFKATASF